MATFSKNEVYTATEVVRNFSSILTKVSKAEMKRAFIVKNNRFEAVLLNMDEYERLNEAVVLLEAIYTTKKVKKEEDGK
ncbi:prevent-host-death protein [Campylobacter hyointestinalis]|uniref:General stress protein 14 (GSP14) n=3 Tax=Campylobacter hyointestinalis TaxID=198 RepID=A0A2S5J8B6_CAMHY|nr:prevent-host-death protein [Campylobacter hyointestinalis]ANE32419.1 putative toxin-antitoxin system, antitoxin component, Phd/YefM family [Campylobacter hyointestinalis subsp. hyointestinalis LMG 9260]ANE34136.1 putative toxin-antitoxin system, antitoxin component, Phd/YefM family [Campylobacter hyointestinalis subsp. lawsonii CCUG 27631]KAB0612746.1 prevent-host-death protein [Campylobacter hyointestinalis subsp. lawsonii]KEA44361.1 prevent-host-death protein [Campylobacter hyointestinalis